MKYNLPLQGTNPSKISQRQKQRLVIDSKHQIQLTILHPAFFRLNHKLSEERNLSLEAF